MDADLISLHLIRLWLESSYGVYEVRSQRRSVRKEITNYRQINCLKRGGLSDLWSPLRFPTVGYSGYLIASYRENWRNVSSRVFFRT